MCMWVTQIVLRLRWCSSIQRASASASSAVVRVSTRTASFSPKIRVEVVASHAIGGPHGRGRSPTMAFSGAVKTLTFSAAVMTVGSPLMAQHCAAQSGLPAHKQPVPRSLVVYADRETRQRHWVHLPRVKVGCQRLSGQKRTEMMYCPQLCSNDTLSGVAGTWGAAVLRQTPIRM